MRQSRCVLWSIAAASLVGFSMGCREREAVRKTVSPNRPPASSAPSSVEDNRPLDRSIHVIRGVVTDSEGEPLPGARVRVKAAPASVTTDADGRFTIQATEPLPCRVTASHDRFVIGGRDWPARDAVPTTATAANASSGNEFRITLYPHATRDHADYQWVDPRPSDIEDDRCANCHPQIFAEWSASGHARAAAGSRFRNVYDGTDAEGRANVGWNLLGDYPEGAGVCASCHLPSLEPNLDESADLRRASEVHQQGVHCDFCHKVADVSIDNVGRSHGRFAMKTIRPRPGEKLQFGPLDDVDRGEDVFAPVFSESRYCATCHEGIVFGTHAYTTWSEWQESDYAERGVDCQDCHMRPTGHMTNFAPGRGGVERDPLTLASHRMPGGDPGFLRNHLKLDVAVSRDAAGRLVVDTVTTPLEIGHSVPTGHPARQVLLWVRAWEIDDGAIEIDGGRAEERENRGDQRRPLELVDGEVLPPLAGDGDPDDGALAGQPGWLFARVIETLDGDPNAPYWKVTRETADTRLKPDVPDQRRFIFAAGSGTVLRIEARLLYRRFSHEVARIKGWTDNEIEIARVVKTLRD